MMLRSRGYLMLPVTLALAVVALAAWMLGREQAVLRATSSLGKDERLYVDLLHTGVAQQKEHMNALGTCTGYANQTFTWGDYQVSNVVTPTAGTDVSITTTVDHVPSGQTVAEFVTPDVPVYQGVNELAIQHNDTVGTDTMISSVTPTYNYGAASELYIGNLENSLLRFSLTSLPSNASLLSAGMELYMESLSTAGSIAVHRVTRDWIEGSQDGFNPVPNGASWTMRTLTLAWTTPGGDFHISPEALVPVDSALRWYNFDITRLTRAWYEGTYFNQGLLLRAEDGLHAARPSAADVSNPTAQFPILRIRWGCECGRVCVAASTCDATVEPTAQVDWHSYNPYAGSTAVMGGITWLQEGERFNGVAAPAGGAFVVADRTNRGADLVAPDGTPLAALTLPTADPEGIAFVRDGVWEHHYALVDQTDNRVYFLEETGTIQGSFLMSTYLTEAYSIDHMSTTGSGTHDGRLLITAEMSMVFVLGSWVATSAPGVRIVDQAGNLQVYIPTGGFAPDPRGVAHIPTKDQFWLLDASGDMYRVNFSGTVLDSYRITDLGGGVTEPMALDLGNCAHVVPDDSQNRIEFYDAP